MEIEKFSNKFLKNFIVDLVDGIWSEWDFNDKFCNNEDMARQMWKVVEEIRAENK